MLASSQRAVKTEELRVPPSLQRQEPESPQRSPPRATLVLALQVALVVRVVLAVLVVLVVRALCGLSVAFPGVGRFPGGAAYQLLLTSRSGLRRDSPETPRDSLEKSGAPSLILSRLGRADPCN